MRDTLIKILIAILAIFTPVKEVMISTLVLIAIDLISGIVAAKKRGESIKSSGFQRTLVKIVVYEIAIAIGFIAQHYLMGDVIPVCNIIGSYVGLTELTSIYENIDGIAGGQLLKTILSRLNSKNDNPDA